MRSNSSAALAPHQALRPYRPRFAPAPWLPSPLPFTCPCAQTISGAAAVHESGTQSFPFPQCIASSCTACQPFGHPASLHPLHFPSSQVCCVPYISFCCCSCGFRSCPCFFYTPPCPGTASCFVQGLSRPVGAEASKWESGPETTRNDACTENEDQSPKYEGEQTSPDLYDLQDNQCAEDVEEGDPQFVLTDEWAEFFAKSEARRREMKKQLKKKKQASNKEIRLSSQQQNEAAPKSGLSPSGIRGSVDESMTSGIE